MAFKSYSNNIKKKLSSSFWENVENQKKKKKRKKKKKKSPNTELFLERLHAANNEVDGANILYF